MSWKAPSRPANEISQTYNDGIVNIFYAKNVAKPGYAPVEDLIPKISLRYEERKLGIQRYYEARQNQIKVQRVIRVPRVSRTPVTSQDVAITEDGKKYRIDLVQLVPNVYPVSDDLTLVDYLQEGKA